MFLFTIWWLKMLKVESYNLVFAITAQGQEAAYDFYYTSFYKKKIPQKNERKVSR